MTKAVDNFALARWRGMDAASALQALADYAKQDASFRPRANTETTRWHATIKGGDFEILCTGPKFYDSRSGHGGGGAIDLVMHLLQLEFKQAVAALRENQL